MIIMIILLAISNVITLMMFIDLSKKFYRFKLESQTIMVTVAKDLDKLYTEVMKQFIELKFDGKIKVDDDALHLYPHLKNAKDSN